MAGRDEYLESTPEFFNIDSRITPDPYFHPPRTPMGYAARNTCGDCPSPGVQTVHPSLGKDIHNDANDPNILGIGKEADTTDYFFGSSMNQRWCGSDDLYWPSRRFANLTGDKGDRALTPQVGYNCRFMHTQDTDCKNCPCLTLRDPCTFKSGAWDKCGCAYPGGEPWFRRNVSSFLSPNNANINANLRWG